MQKITTFLWFNDQAGEAVQFYTSIFQNSRIKNLTHYGQTDKVMSVVFELEGQEFMALNGGSVFSFTPAISLFVKCDTQEEIDNYWNKLSAVPEAEQCGWLKDKYGLSWQIIPRMLNESMTNGDSGKSKRVTEAMLKMKKMDIATLKQAYDG